MNDIMQEIREIQEEEEDYIHIDCGHDRHNKKRIIYRRSRY